MTITRPLRRMILHFSQIGFTDGLTFMGINLHQILSVVDKTVSRVTYETSARLFITRSAYLERQVMRPRVRS